jgi:L-ascorbate metabolism protein UlaG (beta-lactamase superfamily)
LTLGEARCIIRKKEGLGMKIRWYGHAAFQITTAKGVRIIIDPYQSGAFGGALTYGKITDKADIVLTSHDHDDHNYTKDIPGPFTRVEKAGTYEIKDVRITAIPTYHDPSRGRERGNNLLFLVEADSLRVVHMGDLGHALDLAIVKSLGAVDILLVPVGGFYTIDPVEATEVVKSVGPKVTIPMHYKTEKCAFPIAPVEEFIKGKEPVTKVGAAEAEFSRETLSGYLGIYVFEHAL